MTLLIAGDIYLAGGRVKNVALQNKATELFGDFLPNIKMHDLSIGNLESPLINEGKPIDKTGPAIKSPVESLKVLKSAGFDLMTLANNHIMDYGAEGLVNTIEACEDQGINTLGAGISFQEAIMPFHFEKNGLKIAILNIAENEFGTTQGNYPGCHPLNPVKNFYSIKKAVDDSDHVIVIVHGGHEYYEFPSPRMKQTYRFFIDAGASAVIGHHTHCVCGYEIYNNAPICYSLGNFLFDNAEKNKSSVTSWNKGLIAELEISKKGINASYLPFIQNYESVGLRKMKSNELSEFEENMANTNSIIADDEKLEIEFEKYCKKSQRLYSSYIEPHSVGILHALRNRKIIPSILSKRKKNLLLNLTRCESHRDVLIKILSQ